MSVCVRTIPVTHSPVDKVNVFDKQRKERHHACLLSLRVCLAYGRLKGLAVSHKVVDRVHETLME